MTRRVVSGPALALCAVAALAGCGGTGRTTTRSKADFAAATRKVCASSDHDGTLKQRLDHMFAKSKSASSVGAMLDIVEQGFGLTDGQLAKLAKIAPPASSGVTPAGWETATKRVVTAQQAFNDAISPFADAVSQGEAPSLSSADGKRRLHQLGQVGLRREAAARAWMTVGRKAGLAHACDFAFLRLGGS